MDYSEQIDDLLGTAGRYCVQTPTCASKMIDAARSMRYLLTRAEAIEQDRDRLLEAMKPNCLMCDSMHENGNCIEVGGFCTAVPAAYCPLIPKFRARAEAAESREEKAEGERDAAVKTLYRLGAKIEILYEIVEKKFGQIETCERSGQKEE